MQGTEIKKYVVSKEKGKVIGTTKTMLCLQLKDDLIFDEVEPPKAPTSSL